MTEKSTSNRTGLSWGQDQEAVKTPKNWIIAAWICFIVSFLRIPFVAIIAFYLSLALGIVLFRSESRAVKLSGLLMIVLFVLRFIAMILVGYNIITP